MSNGYALPYDTLLTEWEASFDDFDRQASDSLDEFSMDELCKHFLGSRVPASVEPELFSAFRDAYLDEWIRGVSLIPGLPEMLDQLASRYRLAVVSNTHHGDLVTGLLRKAGKDDYFSAVITSVGCGRRKPCPTVYRQALSMTGGRAESTLFVGDSFVHDYAGPRAAGLHALLIDPEAVEAIPVEHRLHHILELRDKIDGERGTALDLPCFDQREVARKCPDDRRG